MVCAACKFNHNLLPSQRVNPFVSGKKSSYILPLISICIYCFFFALDLWKTKVNTYSPFVSTSKSKLAEPEPWLINPIAFLLGTSGILIIFAFPVNSASSGLKSSSNALFLLCNFYMFNRRAVTAYSVMVAKIIFEKFTSPRCKRFAHAISLPSVQANPRR